MGPRIAPASESIHEMGRKPLVGVLRDLGGRVTDVLGLGGADPTGVTDSTATIQAAIDGLPATGGIVFIPPGTYKITSTLTIGNGTSLLASTRSSVTLVGAGRGQSAAEVTPIAAATKLVWAGAAGGTMLSVNGPISAVVLSDFMLDCADLAATGLQLNHPFDSDFSRISTLRYTGFAYKITAHPAPVNCVIGANGNQWTSVRALEKSGASAAGIQIGPADRVGATILNVAQNAFSNCHFSSAAGQPSIELRFTDQLTFTNCVTGDGVGLLVSPPPLDTNFPNTCAFYNCAIIGDVSGAGWTGTHKLLFMPFPKGDGEATPAQNFAMGLTSDGTWFGGI